MCCQQHSASLLWTGTRSGLTRGEEKENRWGLSLMAHRTVLFNYWHLRRRGAPWSSAVGKPLVFFFFFLFFIALMQHWKSAISKQTQVPHQWYVRGRDNLTWTVLHETYKWNRFNLFFCLFVPHIIINIHTYKHSKKKIKLLGHRYWKKVPLLNHNDECTKQ